GLRSGAKKFEETTINYKEDDMLYLFTDGYADQFGGEQSKKFTYKRLKELLLSIHRLRTNEQKVKIEDTIKSWQGENEQIDDMLVIGIKF
ncbi:MAG: PP2C family protein-serine/threonine phosphatase, partial [Bacteroidota bacterium]